MNPVDISTSVTCLKTTWLKFRASSSSSPTIRCMISWAATPMNVWLFNASTIMEQTSYWTRNAEILITSSKNALKSTMFWVTKREQTQNTLPPVLIPEKSLTSKNWLCDSIRNQIFTIYPLKNIYLPTSFPSKTG